MPSIHIICHAKKDGGYQNLSALSQSEFRSACWTFPSSRELEALIGGWIYLHETKREQSHTGGVIASVEPCKRTNSKTENGFAFVFQKHAAGTGQKWRGRDDDRAWNSGIVVSNFSHEAA